MVETLERGKEVPTRITFYVGGGTASLPSCLTQEAQQGPRKEAKGNAPGFAGEHLIRHARQAKQAAHMQEWPASPGLLPPR